MSTISQISPSITPLHELSHKFNSTLDDKLKQACEDLNFSEVTRLIELGGNPNLSISLSPPIISRYLEVHEPLFEGSISLETEEDVKLFIQQFFKENGTHPILFVAALLKEEPLAELLLIKGADTSIELADPEGSKINILQVASALNLLELARFAIIDLGIKINEPEVSGDLSPLAIAIISGEYEMVELLLQLRASEADHSIFQDEYVQQFLETSEKGPLLRALLEQYSITE